MKRIGKPVFVIIALLIVAFAGLSVFGLHSTWGDSIYTYIKGVSDIRWGIDIRGGVEATYEPADPSSATAEQLKGAENVIKQRLVAQNITDSEVYTDTDKMRVVVRFPWPSDSSSFDLDSVIDSLGQQATLTFRKGDDTDESTKKPTGEVILTGDDVASATAGAVSPSSSSKKNSSGSGDQTYAVNLKLNDSGTQKFAEATKELAESKGRISIWLDDEMISDPSVNEEISNGEAQISGGFTAATASQLAATISGGSLPIALSVSGYSTISPTLGLQARDLMGLAGIIAYFVIAAFIIWRYRVPGVAAAVALIGHVAGTLAAVSGFFPFFPSFTLTLPGIAGIILGIGMGVDANVLTASRIHEELQKGRSIDGSIAVGSKRGFTAVLDGNVTVLIISIILMGAFGPPDSLFAMLLKPIFFMFGGTTEGTIFSFGYTMFIGVICNLVFAVFCSRLMLRSLSKYKCFRNPKFYGGANHEIV